MTPAELDRLKGLWERAKFPPRSASDAFGGGRAFVESDNAGPYNRTVARCDGDHGSANAVFIAAAGNAFSELLRLARAGLDAEGEGHATWSHGYDEGRRHGHKECHDEIARLRALLATPGVDADKHEARVERIAERLLRTWCIGICRVGGFVWEPEDWHSATAAEVAAFIRAGLASTEAAGVDAGAGEGETR